MMNIKNLLFSIAILTMMWCFAACGAKGVHDISAYYYPMDALKHGVVYEYQPVDADTLPEEYWYFRSIETDSALYLTANYYDHNFIVRQFSNEEVVANGTMIKDYFLYGVDSLGYQFQIPAEVASPTVFPFEVRDSGGIFLTKLKWVFNESPEQSTTMVRNRRYAGKTTYAFKGTTYDCVVFELREFVDDFNNGHWEKEYTGKEIYAKGLGLIYYKKQIEDHFIMEYELVDTFNMVELERRFSGTLGMR